MLSNTLQVLHGMFPNTLLVPDIRALPALPKVGCMTVQRSLWVVLFQAGCCCWGEQETELVTAGFPCVDVSRAGARAGLEGKVWGSTAALQDSYACHQWG